MKRKHWILAFVPPALIFIDQWTKIIILNKFMLGESIPVISSFFNITYVRNTGAAFGFLATAHPSFRVPFFLVIPVIALVVIGYLFRKLPERDVKTALALSLVMGGAIGNLIDRVRLGYVVDFLDFHWKLQAHFPAFNVADSAICVGVALMMLDFSKKEPV
ncbi:MAG: signal peptidase II [Bdellovibrionales bacterium]|nr:signal peptidase II [Bdellovibrionales bacterium]